MFGTIFYILINIILTSLTAFLATLYILIGHIILHALPQLTLDIPLLIIYAKVGLAGGLVLGALASFITSTWLAICCILLLWKTREEVNEFRKGFSLAFLGPYRTNGTTSTATTTPPANHATSANLGVQEAQEPTTPTPTSKVDRAKETMSWTVAGSVGVYVLQVYYDKFSPAESVDVKVLVDPIQAGLAAGLGRLVGDTFYRALRPVQRPTAPARDDSSDGPK